MFYECFMNVLWMFYKMFCKMFCKQYNVYIILWYDKWIIFQPNNIEAIFNKGLTIFTLGEHTQAIFYFNNFCKMIQSI